MISLGTALKLKAAGLRWTPALHDFFAIPERGMDERLFVLADMLATMEMLQGMEVVAFQGASEWALDALVASEAVWMPTEEQLRQSLEAVLLARGEGGLRLASGLTGCTVEYSLRGAAQKFSSPQASEAYAAALLSLIENELSSGGGPPLS